MFTLGLYLLYCRSVNEVICHGIPDARPLEDGDIVNGKYLAVREKKICFEKK